MRHIFELSRIKGVSEPLFYGGEHGPGLISHITVFGEIPNTGIYPGKININTAPRPILAALLPLEYSGQAQKLVEFRKEKAGSDYIHDLSKTTWYKKVPGFNNVAIDPELISLSSDLFRIESTASIQEMEMRVTTVVRREKHQKSGKWHCKILSWHSS
jgi:general secretion pathway protein K